MSETGKAGRALVRRHRRRGEHAVGAPRISEVGSYRTA